MKKRQTGNTLAQRGLSAAERRPYMCGEPFTLELSVLKHRTGFSRYREVKCPHFAGTRVVPRKFYTFVPCILGRRFFVLPVHIPYNKVKTRKEYKSLL